MDYSFSKLHDECKKVLEHIQREIGSLRTGRASASMLDSVMVDAYGQQMRIVELASISTPDPSLIVVSPWDKSLLGAIEKAISASGISLHPVVDGEIIRIAVPSLTEETRKEMVKELHKRVEHGRVMLRTVRGDIKQDIKSLEDTDGVSEDDIATHLAKLEIEMKQYVEQLESISKSKEADLMTI